MSQLPPLVSLEVRRTGERRYNPIDFTLPGYLTMFVFFVAALGAGSIVLERETRTLERLVSNGVRAPSILAGKFLVAAGRGLTQLAVLWTVGVFAFSIDLGASPGAVVIVSLLFALASAAFGIMLATMVDTMRSASSIAMLASLTLAPLGGCWWPLFIAPDWLQALGRLTSPRLGQRRVQPAHGIRCERVRRRAQHAHAGRIRDRVRRDRPRPVPPVPADLTGPNSETRDRLLPAGALLGDWWSRGDSNP